MFALTDKGATASRWEPATETFVEGRPEAKRALGRRQSQFGNLVRSWGLQGHIVTNWTDDQPRDSAHQMPALQETPVLHYARKRSQRGPVVLPP